MLVDKLFGYFNMAQKVGNWREIKSCELCKFWSGKKCVLKGSKKTKVCEDYEHE